MGDGADNRLPHNRCTSFSTRFFPEYLTVDLREGGGNDKRVLHDRGTRSLPSASSPNNPQLTRGGHWESCIKSTTAAPLRHSLAPESAKTMPHLCGPLFPLMHFKLKVCRIPVARCSGGCLKLCRNPVPRPG